MDQRTFVFATRGLCIKGKQCQHVTLNNKTICLCSKQSSLFSFCALPLVANQKARWSAHLKVGFAGSSDKNIMLSRYCNKDQFCVPISFTWTIFPLCAFACASKAWMRKLFFQKVSLFISGCSSKKCRVKIAVVRTSCQLDIVKFFQKLSKLCPEHDNHRDMMGS